jgi:hypothetical protein
MARQVLVFLLLAWTVRLLVNWTLGRLHLAYVPAFFQASDIFADSVKSALAQRAVTAPLLTDPKVLHWPALFRSYLFDNTYLTPGMSIYWEPPLAALQFMGVGRLIVLSSPWAALATEVAVYALGVASFAWLLTRLEALSACTAVLLAAPMCLSYPALVMLDRGNFHSGFASLCLAVYFCTAFTGRWRWLGVMALCYSINVRPNTAIVALVELVLARDFISAVRFPVVIAAISGEIFFCSLLIVHQIDTGYEFSSFVNGYDLYQKKYIIDGLGLAWNDSLYGAVQILRLMFGLTPAYSRVASGIVSAMGVVSLLGFVWLAAGGRLRRGEAFFAAAAFCALFTPVYGQYHILIFVGVLAVLALESVRRPNLQWAWLGFVLLAVIGCAADLVPNRISVLLLLLGSVFIITRLRVEDGDDMIWVVSLLVLAPLGGQYANGVLVAALLAAAMLALYVRAVRRPVVTAAPFIAWFQGRIRNAAKAYRG